MTAASTPGLPARLLPVQTVSLVVAAGLIYVLPWATPWLIYDRASIQTGEIWRLVTGHWTHFSPSHLAYNLAALAIVGTLIEAREKHRLVRLCLASSVTIGISLFVFQPDLDRFAGASGVVHGAVAYFCARESVASGPLRIVRLAVLALLVAKIALESLSPGPSLVGVSGNFVVVPLCHAVGALSGLLVFLADLAFGRLRKRRLG